MDLRTSCARIGDRPFLDPPEKHIFRFQIKKLEAFWYLLQVGLPKNVCNSISPNMDLQTSCTQVFNSRISISVINRWCMIVIIQKTLLFQGRELSLKMTLFLAKFRTIVRTHGLGKWWHRASEQVCSMDSACSNRYKFVFLCNLPEEILLVYPSSNQAIFCNTSNQGGCYNPLPRFSEPNPYEINFGINR